MDFGAPDNRAGAGGARSGTSFLEHDFAPASAQGAVDPFAQAPQQQQYQQQQPQQQPPPSAFQESFLGGQEMDPFSMPGAAPTHAQRGPPRPGALSIRSASSTASGCKEFVL